MKKCIKRRNLPYISVVYLMGGYYGRKVIFWKGSFLVLHIITSKEKKNRTFFGEILTA
jgi:hypothetical protein